jgi:hypothetical protein
MALPGRTECRLYYPSNGSGSTEQRGCSSLPSRTATTLWSGMAARDAAHASGTCGSRVSCSTHADKPRSPCESDSTYTVRSARSPSIHGTGQACSEKHRNSYSSPPRRSRQGTATSAISPALPNPCCRWRNSCLVSGSLGGIGSSAQS